uniref:Mitogen-activated protein kinase kinase kinase 19 n=1 Tax=Maylandia zebra TaxID=106582 RepID=A0A3P9AVL7_9CICH
DPSTTKDGSVESGSSSSHSSVDLEDEDADRDQDAYLTVSHDRMLELPKDASTTEADRTGKTVILDSSDADAANKEYSRLQGEVELLKTLRHINIVGFLGTSLQQHVVSIFMEYIPGGSIASIIHRFGPLPERVLALYTQQILEGVAYLHMNRVIHRDLKGNNVMLMPTGVIKLIDFGCARRLSYMHHTTCNSVDLLKSVHGTPYWMAPETFVFSLQIINETGYGRKSDIWSVGCTVFEMATGKPPLAHMDKMEVGPGGPCVVPSMLMSPGGPRSRPIPTPEPSVAPRPLPLCVGA